MARVLNLNDVMKIVVKECEFHQKNRLAPPTIQDIS